MVEKIVALLGETQGTLDLAPEAQGTLVLLTVVAILLGVILFHKN
jgi:hypothetical protein